MRLHSIWVAAMLIVAAACGRKAEKTAGEKTPEKVETADPADPCRKRLEAISARLAPYAAGLRAPVFARGDLPLLTSKAARPIDERGPVVTVRPNVLELFGQRYGSIADLAERLRAERRAAEMHRDPATGPAPLYLHVDSTLPLAALTPIVRATAAGFRPRLLVERPGARETFDVPAGASSALRALLEGLRDKLDPAERAVFLAGAMESAIGFCSALVKLFGDTAALSPDEKHRVLMKGFAPALRECECRGVDLDVLEVYLLEVSDAYRAPQGWLPLEPDSRGRIAPEAGLDDSATVGDLVAALDKTK